MHNKITNGKTAIEKKYHKMKEGSIGNEQKKRKVIA